MNTILFGNPILPLPHAVIREENPHFGDSPITVVKFEAYPPDSSCTRDFGFTHYVEVSAFSNRFGCNCHAVYNYNSSDFLKANPYHKGVTMFYPKGWSLGAN